MIIAANLVVFVSVRGLWPPTRSLFSNLRLPPTARSHRESFGLPHASRLAVRCAHRDPHGAGNLKQTQLLGEKRMKTVILNSLNRLHNDEAGQGLVEYLLILALGAEDASAGRKRRS